MLTLKLLQNDLQCYLLHNDEAINKAITQPQQDSVTARLQIYSNAYRYRLIDILKADYLALCVLIGDEKFEQLALEYLASHPSHYFTVRHFGSHFIEFLKQSALYKTDPYIVDMATFEWALVNTGDAADAPIITLNDLTTIPQEQWGRLRFTEHPSLQIITLSTNVAAFWQANAEKNDLPALERMESQRWRLWRQGVQSFYFPLSEHEYIACLLMCKQKTFAEICESLCAHLPEQEVPQIVAGYLIRWLNEGILSTVSLAPED